MRKRTPEKALNYIGKQEGNSREALREWEDYLDMAEQERPWMSRMIS